MLLMIIIAPPEASFFLNRINLDTSPAFGYYKQTRENH